VLKHVSPFVHNEIYTAKPSSARAVHAVAVVTLCYQVRDVHDGGCPEPRVLVQSCPSGVFPLLFLSSFRGVCMIEVTLLHLLYLIQNDQRFEFQFACTNTTRFPGGCALRGRSTCGSNVGFLRASVSYSTLPDLQN
jgi:hypothetical protein